MEPIVLIHGYSAESKGDSEKDIHGIYGTLPEDLRYVYGAEGVVEIDLSRYISLDDGITIDDISRALDRALNGDAFKGLLETGFNVIIHSTGALVIRNWIRRFSKKPSPIKHLVYLAGANLGSGWAHIGKGQIANWGRYVFQDGAERGVQVLDALELGSDWTLDLQLHFLSSGNNMTNGYQILEAVLVGTQADVSWYEAPIRYAKEDGADGVVRVSASNVNYHYVRFGPTQKALNLSWEDAAAEHQNHRNWTEIEADLYEVKLADESPSGCMFRFGSSRPGDSGRPEVPFAIPYQCAHSGEEMGIVTGSAPRKQVLRLLQQALAAGPNDWPGLVAKFDLETTKTYDRARKAQAPSWWKKWIQEPRAQYDPHAQLVFRVRDQDGRPVPHYDIFFDSDQKKSDLAILHLFEDKHVNELAPNVIAFYLRTSKFDRDAGNGGDWVDQIPLVNGCFLEVSAADAGNGRAIYLPLRFWFEPDQLSQWVRGHRTTIVDVELLRLPAPEVFQMVRFTGEE
jgi:hypothetical protein